MASCEFLLTMFLLGFDSLLAGLQAAVRFAAAGGPG
jgi:hypothetical protein